MPGRPGRSARNTTTAPVSQPVCAATSRPSSAAVTLQAASQPASQPTTAPSSQPYEGEVTVPLVETYETRLKAMADVPKEEKEAALDLYKQALAQSKIADDWKVRAAQYKQAIEKIPAQLAEAKAKLAKPAADLTPQVPDHATVAQIEQAATQAAETDLAARMDVSSLSRDQQAILDRRQEIPARQAAIRQSQAQINDELQKISGSTSQVDQARRVLLQAKRRALARDACPRPPERRRQGPTGPADRPDRSGESLSARNATGPGALAGLALKQRTAAEAAKVAAQASQQSITFKNRPESTRSPSSASSSPRNACSVCRPWPTRSSSPCRQPTRSVRSVGPLQIITTAWSNASTPSV